MFLPGNDCHKNTTVPYRNYLSNLINSLNLEFLVLLKYEGLCSIFQIYSASFGEGKLHVTAEVWKSYLPANIDLLQHHFSPIGCWDASMKGTCE